MNRPTTATEPAPAKAGGPDPVDLHVGRQVRQRRTLLGMSQETLGHRLDISFQQVQKYEHGKNRVSASKLHALCGILAVPVSYFFDGLPDTPGAAPAPAAEDVMCRRETLDLARAYYAITDVDVRKRLADLVKAIGRAAEREAA